MSRVAKMWYLKAMDPLQFELYTMSGIFDRYFQSWSSSSRPRRMSSSRMQNTRSDVGIAYGKHHSGDPDDVVAVVDGVAVPVATTPNIRTQYSWKKEKRENIIPGTE